MAITPTYKALYLNVHGEPSQEVDHAKQGDQDAYGVEVHLQDDNGQSISVSGAASATIRVAKPDGNYVEKNANIDTSNNVVKAIYTDQMLAVPGASIVDISLLDSNGKRMSSVNYTLVVEKMPWGIGVDSETDIATIDNAVTAATEAAAAANTAATAAATAQSAAETAATRAETAQEAVEDLTTLRQELESGLERDAGLHLGFYLDENGDLCQVESTE